MRERLIHDDFTAELDGPQGPLQVHYPPQWPGAVLPLFASRLHTQPEHGDPWSYTAVRREDGRAIGQLSGKGGPDAEGRLEIGYGFNAEVWGHGYATEAVGAMVQAFRQRPEVQQIWAQTATHNRASARVLEKLGFIQTGQSFDLEDGPLLVWTLPYTRLSATS